jgi:glyoxylase-like metal-dependent hydrolase (beta-lactamase superfamily II)
MSGTGTQRWQIGDVTVTSVVEDQVDHIPPEMFFPEADAPAVRAHPWCIPDFADEQGNITLRVQALVVEVAGRRILVDPCVGNGKTRSLPFWHEQSWPFLERLGGAGFEPASIGTVLHTHLHADHVGWDTHLEDGEWVPTFTGARHLYTQAELDACRDGGGMDAAQTYADSVAPIVAAGLVDVVEPDADLGDGLRLSSTPGHTPGHVSLWIERGDRTVLVTGDVLHHPVQCSEPLWAEVGDDDAEVARATRRALLGRAAAGGVLFIGTHVPNQPAGRLVAHGDAWRFTPEAGAPVG